MRRLWATKARVAVAALSMVLAEGVLSMDGARTARAADHLDPPTRTNVGANSDVAADIADVFLFHTPTTVVVSVTGAGPQGADVGPIYDRNVVTLVHLSNVGVPTTDEFVIDVRYGRDAGNRWGVQFKGVPGASAPIVGPVQTNLTDA